MKSRYKVWIAMENRCFGSIAKAHLSKLKKGIPVVKQRILKTRWYPVLKFFGITGLTYLYSVWAIRQAFIQRGYRAYGGEYLMIPIIFYGIYKVLDTIERF